MGKPKNEIAKRFNISQSTLPIILKNKDDILREYETKWRDYETISEYTGITEVGLLNRFIRCKDLNIPINGQILKGKAEFLVIKLGHKQLNDNQGWLNNWKSKNATSFFVKVSGENAYSVDQ